MLFHYPLLSMLIGYGNSIATGCGKREKWFLPGMGGGADAGEQDT